MQTTKSQQAGERTQIELPYGKCPKSKYGMHRTKEIKRESYRPGIIISHRQCQHCGGIEQIHMDYNVLAGIF